MIAVDFDDTICDFDFPGIGAPKQGAKQALETFRRLGYLIHIYSCRSCHWYPDEFLRSGGEGPDTPVTERRVFKEMKAWLDKHEIPYDSIDDGSKGKPFADYYVDDKAVRFENNWEEIALRIDCATNCYHAGVYPHVGIDLGEADRSVQS